LPLLRDCDFSVISQLTGASTRWSQSVHCVLMKVIDFSLVSWQSGSNLNFSWYAIFGVRGALTFGITEYRLFIANRRSRFSAVESWIGGVMSLFPELFLEFGAFKSPELFLFLLLLLLFLLLRSRILLAVSKCRIGELDLGAAWFQGCFLGDKIWLFIISGWSLVCKPLMNENSVTVEFMKSGEGVRRSASREIDGNRGDSEGFWLFGSCKIGMEWRFIVSPSAWWIGRNVWSDGFCGMNVSS